VTHEEGDQINILNVIRYPIGGIRSYLKYTYPKLTTRYRTTIVTVNRPEALLLPSGMTPLEVDLALVSERGPIWSLAWRARTLLAGRRYQLVHAQGFTAAIVTLFADPGHRVPRVVTLHETLTPQHLGSLFGFGKRAFLARVLGAMDSIVVVGEDAYANLTEALRLSPRTRSRIRIIRNGVSVQTLRAEAEQPTPNIRAQLGLDEGTPLVGFVGRFMPEKGFDLLIDAVGRIHGDRTVPAPFKVIAVNDGAFVREYRHQIAERGLASLFAFVETQPSVSPLVRQMNAIVMPSRREACPLVAMEAMILGCPLIASDCIGLREVTRGRPVFQVQSGDSHSLAGGLAACLNDPERALQQARAYATTAQADFDSTRTAYELEAAFADVLRAPDAISPKS